MASAAGVITRKLGRINIPGLGFLAGTIAMTRWAEHTMYASNAGTAAYVGVPPR